MALYTDKASHFKTTRHGGFHYQVEVEQKETQIQRALGELGIKLINASSPQAKGRIERKFRFFQDRLIKEMRLRGINNYEEANRFLKGEFLPWCNSKYSISVESLYMPVSEGKDLDLIFSIRHPRKVNKDNTIKFCGKIYQLLPMNGVRSFAGKWVEVCELKDAAKEILWEGKRIGFIEIGRDNKNKGTKAKIEDEVLGLRIMTEEKEIKRERKRYTPPANHPWKRDWRKKRNVTFSLSNNM